MLNSFLNDSASSSPRGSRQRWLLLLPPPCRGIVVRAHTRRKGRGRRRDLGAVPRTRRRSLLLGRRRAARIAPGPSHRRPIRDRLPTHQLIDRRCSYPRARCDPDKRRAVPVHGVRQTHAVWSRAKAHVLLHTPTVPLAPSTASNNRRGVQYLRPVTCSNVRCAQVAAGRPRRTGLTRLPPDVADPARRYAPRGAGLSTAPPGRAPATTRRPRPLRENGRAGGRPPGSARRSR